MSEHKTRAQSLLAVLVVFATVLLVRIVGSSDLYTNDDQIRTLAFSADVAINHRWLLPCDFAGYPARKPPFVNWIGALVLKAGFWTEWAFKFPSMLGAFLALFSVYVATLELSKHRELHGHERYWIAAAAACIYLACPETVKHTYFLRPDMLHTGLLGLTWLVCVLLLKRGFGPRSLVLAFWGAIGLAFLTKGPSAFIPLVFVVVSSFTREGKGLGKLLFRPAGVLLAIGLAAVWVMPLWLQHRDYLINTLVLEEVAYRTGQRHIGAWLTNCLITAWKIPYWFVERFFPWSLIATSAIFKALRDAGFRNAVAPAVLWVLCTLGFYLPVEHKGGSFFMPAYPAAATLTALFLTDCKFRHAVTPRTLFVAAFCVALIIVTHKGLWGRAAQTRAGDEIKLFAKEARALVASDPVTFVNCESNPVIGLMGRHQCGAPSDQQLKDSPWIVYAIAAAEMETFLQNREPVLVSRRIVGFGREVHLCLVRQTKI